jgi:hypothetical protein
VEAPAATLKAEAKSSAKVNESAPLSMAAPVAHVHVELVISPEVEVNVEVSTTQADQQAAARTNPSKGMAYLDGMRAVGYPLDLTTI